MGRKKNEVPTGRLTFRLPQPVIDEVHSVCQNPETGRLSLNQLTPYISSFLMRILPQIKDKQMRELREQLRARNHDTETIEEEFTDGFIDD